MAGDDEVCVSGLLEGGAALSIHYRGGRSRGTNLLWEINGTEAICNSPPPAGKPRSSRWTYAAARARSPRSRSCPCQSAIVGHRHKAQALPPTSPKRTRVSPSTIARVHVSAPPLRTLSYDIACL